MTSTVPTREPDVFRRFQYTDFRANSNKKWDIEAWDMGGYWLQRTKWSRTGRPKPQVKVKQVRDRRDVESLINAKLNKGYEELDLAKVAVSEGPSVGNPAIDQLVTDVYSEANLYIDSYLSTTVDQLSERQLRKGREILLRIAGGLGSTNMSPRKAAENPDYQSLAEAYYRAIPTQLPHWIDPVKVTRDLISDLHEQEERIDQLENAVRSRHKVVKQNGSASALDLLGAEVEALEVGSPEYARIEQMVLTTRRHQHLYGREPVTIYKVCIPNERDAFDKNHTLVFPPGYFEPDASKAPNELSWGPQRGLFFHGTRSANVKYILEKGLIIPSHAANGSMFGRGIYFADVSTKSLQYSQGRNVEFLLVAEVALGNLYEAPAAMTNITGPPSGYHSVWGRENVTRSYGGRLRFNEYIVYNVWQQTIRYLVVMG